MPGSGKNTEVFFPMALQTSVPKACFAGLGRKLYVRFEYRLPPFLPDFGKNTEVSFLMTLRTSVPKACFAGLGRKLYVRFEYRLPPFLPDFRKNTEVFFPMALQTSVPKACSIDLRRKVVAPGEEIRPSRIFDLLRRRFRVLDCRFSGVAFSVHPNPNSSRVLTPPVA